MQAIDKNFFTWNDYVTWEGRWELINGEAYDMSPVPYPKHQRLVGRIYREFSNTLDCKECEVYISPVDWKIDEYNVVQPDVALFCEEPKEQYFSKTPPLVVEVLSKSTAKKDINEKFSLYEKNGVKFYMLVEPNSEIVDIFELKNGKYEFQKKLTCNDSYAFELDKCSLSVDFNNVF
ncbi:Uma2 family endonuclease [Sulfurimonas sp. SWIR-19]|uniref:Uma2 family endonuclease n=1 Tax=Sulfurimonas sp. SWIR-19 TaxID=2878390 RepID=UPI001CF2145A|nr:Uma2 family endonuclease [Sulfurimonas sp. SWIR-19]UCN00794.1 Uma2 family endonuclease [Sulfurimonas sp. SWIR-19]